MSQTERRMDRRRQDDRTGQDIRLLLTEIRVSQQGLQEKIDCMERDNRDYRVDQKERMERLEGAMSCDVNREKLRIIEKILYGLITCCCVLTFMVISDTYKSKIKENSPTKVEVVNPGSASNGK